MLPTAQQALRDVDATLRGAPTMTEILSLVVDADQSPEVEEMSEHLKIEASLLSLPDILLKLRKVFEDVEDGDTDAVIEAKNKAALSVECWQVLELAAQKAMDNPGSHPVATLKVHAIFSPTRLCPS